MAPPADAHLTALADATFAVLERTGVIVHDPAAVDALAAAGARRQGNRVRIPRRLVQRAVESAPRTVALHDADGRPAIELGRGRVHFGLGSDTPHVRDVRTGERRRALLADIANAATPTSLRSALDKQRGRTPFSVKSRAGVYAMLISPLVHAPEVTPMIRTCAEAGVPLIYASGVIAGATGPATLAGAVVVGAAECLSGLVMHQLARTKGSDPFFCPLPWSSPPLRSYANRSRGPVQFRLRQSTTRSRTGNRSAGTRS